MSETCRVCGKELSDPNSVEKGIGPICAKRLQELRKHEPIESPYTKKAYPEEIKVQDRFRKQLGDLIPLMESIVKVGLLHPIVITKNNRLVAGERRLAAWKLLHPDQPIPVNIIPEYLADAEIEENTVRQDFTASELAAIYKHYKPQIEQQAKKRQGTRTDLGNIVENFHEVGKTRDIIGNIAGVSGKTLEKAVKISDIAGQSKKAQKILEQVDKGQRSIDWGYKRAKILEKQLNNADFEPVPLPEGKFNIIYADPPWRYNFSETESRAIETHYSTMSLEEICLMEVPSADNAVLLLWATNPKLEEALRVIKSWGFEYKTNLVWVKDKIGMGYWFRGQHELLLLATKGTPPTPLENKRVSGVLESPRMKHSSKPTEIYEIIENYFPTGKYLELFSRNKRKNWTMWGNETQ
jgi:N6-adenosine-specific RNA methylase IME4